MAKKKRKKVTSFRQAQKTVTYNKQKPNRQARRLGVQAEKPQEPTKPVKVNRAAVLQESIERAEQARKKIVPPSMTYGEYMQYLREKRQQLQEKKANS